MMRPSIVLTRRARKKRIMDPDCAICGKPAMVQCECEAKGLDIAIRQAEQKMMSVMLTDIRTWVRTHAQDYILEYFSILTTRRKDAHSARIRAITEHAAYYYHSRPHPSEITAVDVELKRGIDEDWKTSVQRYPEVLEYFYSLVDLNLPSDNDPSVREPPFNSPARKMSRQDTGGSRRRGERAIAPPAPASHHMHAIRDRSGRMTAPPPQFPGHGQGFYPPPPY